MNEAAISSDSVNRPRRAVVDTIDRDDRVYAYVIGGASNPTATQFVTPDSAVQQVGFVVHAAGSEVKRHYHLPLERRVVGTPEVLIVRSGHCVMDVYDDEQELIRTRQLYPGDIVVMVGGGHGFRMLEDTTLIEVKQGPYLGSEEKSHF